MADFVDLRPGQRVQVLRRGDDPRRAHTSTIREVGADAIRIDTPRRDGKALTANEDQTLQLLMELHGRMYTFSTRVQSLPDGGATHFWVEMPRMAERSERREFFRLNTMISPRYAAITSGDGDEIDRVEAVILDISGGGVRLRTHSYVEPGALLRLIFRLSDGEDVDLTCDVRECAEDGRRGAYRVHARFRERDRATEDRIVRHVFSEQVQLLQKGAL